MKSFRINAVGGDFMSLPAQTHSNAPTLTFGFMYRALFVPSKSKENVQGKQGERWILHKVAEDANH